MKNKISILLLGIGITILNVLFIGFAMIQLYNYGADMYLYLDLLATLLLNLSIAGMIAPGKKHIAFEDEEIREVIDQLATAHRHLKDLEVEEKLEKNEELQRKFEELT